MNEVIFVSLNYDLLLDNALLAADPDKGDMRWYLSEARNWSLVKLHGSVDWGRRVALDSGAHGLDIFTAPSAQMQLAEDIVLRSGQLYKIRGFLTPDSHSAATLFFPALAAPVGQADELVCPPDQVAFLKQRLADTQPMHLLVIGYSGLDQEVVSLIRESERGVKTLTIVDRGKEATKGVAERLAQQGVRAQDTRFEAEGFNAWVRTGELDKFVHHMSNEPF